MRKLFIDGSVEPKLKFGFAGYLLIDSDENLDLLSEKIKVKKFENTSSTKLELQTFLWAIEDINVHTEIEIYTDCQNLLSLIERRVKLESNNYTNSKGLELRNAQLYKKFYFYYDLNRFKLIKIKGHKKSSLRNTDEEIFSLVDKEVRRNLKIYIKNNKIR